MTSPLYGLAICPPPDLSQRYARIRAELDPVHAPSTVPHVTVKQAFHLPEQGADEAALVSVLRSACARHAPFELELGDAGARGERARLQHDARARRAARV